MPRRSKRHLVLPDHIDCCSKPIIDWIAKNIPESLVNVMGQYRPDYHAKDYDEISRAITKPEVHMVEEYAIKKGLFLI